MKKYMKTITVLVLAILFPFFVSTNLSAQNYTIEKIVDNTSPIPGGIGLFQTFNLPVPSIAMSEGAFVGGADFPQGVYTLIDDTVALVADEFTPIPMGTGNFVEFFGPTSLGGGNVAFFGSGLFGQTGIYAFVSETLLKIADNSTEVPMGSGNFEAFDKIVPLGSGDIAFIGFNSLFQAGVYALISGSLVKVVDLNTIVPMGTGTFSSIEEIISLDNGDLIIKGRDSSSEDGIYLFSGGSLTMIANESTPIPMGTDNFLEIRELVNLSGEDFAFIARGNMNQLGIYARISNVLTKLVDRNDAVPPMNTENFFNFEQIISLGGSDIAFNGNSGDGIYSLVSGVISKVADTNTPIPMGSGNFEEDFIYQIASIGGGDVAFIANNSMGLPDAIYYFSSGTLSLIANLNTPIPGGGGVTFQSNFNDLISLEGGGVVFTGFGTEFGGIYKFDGSILTSLIDGNTSVPMSNDNFLFSFGLVSIGIGDLAFIGSADSIQNGIYSFTGGLLSTLVDRNTSVPMSMENYEFISFLTPIQETQDFMFISQMTGASGLNGIYKSTGGVLSTIVDTNTPIPSGGSFQFFRELQYLGGGDIAFFSSDISNNQGIFAIINGNVVKIADSTIPVPMGTGTFIDFQNRLYTTTDGVLVFNAQGSSGEDGIYQFDGINLTKIVDNNTPIPMDSGNFAFFGNNTPINVLNNGDIAFWARGQSSSQEGIYKFDGSNITKIVDRNTTAPSGGSFNSFSQESNISLEGNDIAFFAFAFPERGFYKFDGTNYSVLVDTNTPIPMGIGNFSDFHQRSIISLGRGDFAFIGLDSSFQQGIYASIRGSLFKVVDVNDLFPMGTGNFEYFSDLVSFGDGDIAFFGFDGMGQFGTYLAKIDLGTLTIVKESDPDGATGFEFTGTDFPAGCVLDGTFTLDDDGFEECDLPSGSYTVQETNSQGFTISDIDCVGASDFSETADSVTVNLADGENVVCTFTNTQQFNIDIVVNGSGSGTVTYAPGGAVCPGDCTETFDINSTVTLTPTATLGSIFTGWSGPSDCSDGIIQNLTSNITCTATFSLSMLDLNIALSGTGVGNVSAVGIDCGDGGVDCVETYNFGTQVALTPTPGFVSTFVGFTGDADCTDGVVTIDSSKTCTAIFDIVPSNINLGALIPSQAGVQNSFNIQDATPNQNITIIWSFNANGVAQTSVSPDEIRLASSEVVTNVAPDDICQGLNTPLANPRILTTIQTDSNGDASFSFPMPSLASGLTFFFQAVDLATCTGSNVNQEVITSSPSVDIVLSDVNPGQAGGINTIGAEGATPNGDVTFIWGFQAGSETASNICPGFQSGIINPRRLRTIRATSSGVAAFNINIPGNLSGVSLVLQAVDLTSCTGSNVNAETL